MHTPKIKLLLIGIVLLVCMISKAQDSSKVDKLLSLPDKLFGALDKKTRTIEQKLDRQTERYLTKLQKQENKLRKKLWRKDSALAKQIFDGTDEKYDQLKNQLNNSISKPFNKYQSVYSGHLDSLTTTLSFLKTDKLPGISNLSSNPELEKTLSQYKELQSKLNASDQIRKYLQQRQQLLKEQFQKLGMVKEVKKFREKVYYYQAQVKQYKQDFEDPNKIEERLLSLAMRIPQFKSFFANNSIFGRFFTLPASTTVSINTLVTGLQTRSLIYQSLIDRFGSTSNIPQVLQQNIQSAQGQMGGYEGRIASMKNGSLGNSKSNLDAPDFTPNSQKTKSLFKRLEYGANIQSQRGSIYFPVTSDIGLSIGYKPNDKSVIGIGGSYKLGLGSGWNNIRLSHQGVGLRTFIDWKLKGSIYMSGGYEQNYRTEFHSLSQLQNYSAWQSSGLLGLSKKYQLSKKMKGEMKLLWDFLSYQQVPRTQAILFRIGYNF